MNINDTVKVKLTESGRKFIRKVQEDEDGWSEWSLWDFMETFGSMLHCKPFEPDIKTNNTTTDLYGLYKIAMTYSEGVKRG